MIEGKCKSCRFWKNAMPSPHRRNLMIGDCCSEEALEYISGYFLSPAGKFGCRFWQQSISEARKLGLKFIEDVREIIQEANKVDDPGRRARLAAFGILTMLDGSGESFVGTPSYRVYRICDDDEYRIVLDFKHHDL